MEKIDIGIPDTHRESVAFALNQLLADEHVLYVKTRNYHWNVTGQHFQSLHSFFEEQYEALSDIIDELAERIRAIGHYAVAALKDYVQLARLLETGHEDGTAEKMLQNLLNDHETIIRILRQDLENAERHHDLGTAGFLARLLEKHEKMAWMLRAYLS
ncbi:Dps family protein [Tunicatimonas pelagia]|uniref:Dps family protein n=1 Tax=Tunicatimonas pelagia TaxID=931531 RepID=UPI002666BF21|nr:DNA starvation/stationary phase protection protein [Tunicatimonas pelagia]WKN44817.1 DNA starvation/stationary phase protection protein [Tunicatimonas pelagia]